jgi:hypothetical protein
MDSILIRDEKTKTKKLIKLKKTKKKQPKKPKKKYNLLKNKKKSILFSFDFKNMKPIPIELDRTRIVE